MRSNNDNELASAEAKMPEITEEIKEIEFDEMWHFIGTKTKENGYSKQWIAKQEKLLPWLQVIVMLKPSENYTTKSNN